MMLFIEWPCPDLYSPTVGLFLWGQFQFGLRCVLLSIFWCLDHFAILKLKLADIHLQKNAKHQCCDCDVKMAVFKIQTIYSNGFKTNYPDWFWNSKRWNRMYLGNTDNPGQQSVYKITGQLAPEQQSPNMAKISKSYILTPPQPQGYVMSVKCEEPINELTVQVWLLYHHPNFKYCSL